MRHQNESGADLLPCVEIEPRGPADAAVIVLHGLGADGHDLAPIVSYLGLREDHATRFVFPHAPSREVTINAGVIMPAWYDIWELDLRREHDEKGVRESAARVRALISREVRRGIEPGRIVLAGFSQGGAMALHVALRHDARLAAVVALSTYVVLLDSLEAEIHEANRGLPIFQGHGIHDDVVPLRDGEEARDRLTALAYPVEWRTYEMGHEIHPRELADVGAFLRARLDRPS